MAFPRLFYVLLLFIASWCGYYLIEKDNTNDLSITKNLQLPQFTGDDMTSTTFNDKGFRTYVITSNHLEYFSTTGDTFFFQSVLKIFRDGKTLEWEISADDATLSKKQLLTLTGNVVAKNLLPNSGLEAITTDQMTIDLVNRNFWSDAPVTLVGPQFKTVGQAIKGNFSANTAKLYNNVQGKYEKVAH